MATVMVVGSGGREMAQALALAKSAAVAKVLVAPGNGGTASCHPKISNLSDVKDSDVPGVVAAAKAHGVGLVAIGPEAPLVAGVADALAAESIPCFGPSKIAALGLGLGLGLASPNATPESNQVQPRWRRSSRTRRRG